MMEAGCAWIRMGGLAWMFPSSKGPPHADGPPPRRHPGSTGGRMGWMSKGDGPAPAGRGSQLAQAPPAPLRHLHRASGAELGLRAKLPFLAPNYSPIAPLHCRAAVGPIGCREPRPSPTLASCLGLPLSQAAAAAAAAESVKQPEAKRPWLARLLPGGVAILGDKVGRSVVDSSMKLRLPAGRLCSEKQVDTPVRVVLCIVRCTG